MDSQFNYNRELFSLQDISFFSKFDYDDYKCLYLKVPRKPTNPTLLDFREGVPNPF
jgi:hypothetical protein